MTWIAKAFDIGLSVALGAGMRGVRPSMHSGLFACGHFSRIGGAIFSAGAGGSAGLTASPFVCGSP
jgi:hypothetical protein